MKRLRINLLLLLPLLLCFSAPPSRLQQEIDRLNADPDLAAGSWGLCVLTTDSGRVIAANEADHSLVPASTLKVLTTGAALQLLGPDYRYETTLEYEGRFDSLSGELSGDLYIRGSGDPTLDSRHFRKEGDSTQLQRWAAALRKRGIKRITGGIVADDLAFGENPVPDGWTWGDLGQYYGAPASALCYRDNSYSLFFTTRGDTATLTHTTPAPEGVQLVNRVKAGGSKDEAYVYGAPFGTVQFITGRVPKAQTNYEVEAALPDPALQCAADFSRELKAQGITVKEAATTLLFRNRTTDAATPQPRKQLLSTRSPRLADIVYWTNLKSNNVYAEQLLRTLGRLKGKSGSTVDGVAVVTNFWQPKGMSTNGFFMTDGSGLSRSNAITPRQQATVLRLLSTFPKKEEEAFQRSLPVAGKSGSLANLCKGTVAENNVKAKSGYITRARGYCGYVNTRSGKRLCFSLLANNYTCTATEMKKKLERVLVALAELP